MPVKYRNKIYKAGGLYHIYNRGLDGRDVFRDEKDFAYFEQVLGQYLLPLRIETEDGFKVGKPSWIAKRKAMNLAGQVVLVAYCLMPDHFHLLVKQNQKEGITQLMRRVITNYVMYFNKRYQRRGQLFENVYRAVGVEDEEQALLLTKYIHLNPVIRTVRRFGPVETITGSKPEDYMYSSYRSYIGIEDKKWVSFKLFTGKAEEYVKLVEKAVPDWNKTLVGLLLD